MAKANNRYNKRSETNITNLRTDKNFDSKEMNNIKKENTFPKQRLQNPPLIIKNLK